MTVHAFTGSGSKQPPSGQEPPMESRVAALEVDVSYIKRDINEIKEDSKEINSRLITIERMIAVGTGVVIATSVIVGWVLSNRFDQIASLLNK